MSYLQVFGGLHVVSRCRQVKNTSSECVFAFISCWHAAKQSVKQPKNSFVKKKKKKISLCKDVSTVAQHVTEINLLPLHCQHIHLERRRAVVCYSAWMWNIKTGVKKYDLYLSCLLR